MTNCTVNSTNVLKDLLTVVTVYAFIILTKAIGISRELLIVIGQKADFRISLAFAISVGFLTSSGLEMTLLKVGFSGKVGNGTSIFSFINSTKSFRGNDTKSKRN